jgi:hypothetical protein
MITVTVFTTHLHNGEFSERLAARFTVRGQQLELLEGVGRFVRTAMPVYSERYGEMIDFNTDGEEWARCLPTACRNGSISAESEETVESPRTRREPFGRRVPALAYDLMRGRRS